MIKEEHIQSADTNVGDDDKGHIAEKDEPVDPIGVLSQSTPRPTVSSLVATEDQSFLVCYSLISLFSISISLCCYYLLFNWSYTTNLILINHICCHKLQLLRFVSVILLFFVYIVIPIADKGHLEIICFFIINSTVLTELCN